MEEKHDNLLFFETEGFSMWPSVLRKQRLIAKKVPLESLNSGDLVVYRVDSEIVCHRLVRRHRDNSKFYCRGDASWSGEEPVDSKMFLGRVVGIVKNGRNVWLDGFWWGLFNRVSIFIIPIFALAIEIIMKFRRKN